MAGRAWIRGGKSKIPSPFFRLLDFAWPKNRRLVVFYGGRGVGYADNARYLFEEFVNAYSGEFEILWVTPCKGTLSDESIDEKWRSRMVHMYSVRGILTLLRTGILLFSWAPPGFPRKWFSRRTVTVQLWHGIPIKRIGKCTRHRGQNRIDVEAKAFGTYTYWICSSWIERNSIALCTGIPIDNVKVTGYPRNDHLVEHKDPRHSELSERFPFLDKKLILYAPTWHPDSKVRFFPFDDFEIEELSSLLERNDAYMILRAHYANDTPYCPRGRGLQHIQDRKDNRPESRRAKGHPGHTPIYRHTDKRLLRNLGGLPSPRQANCVRAVRPGGV